MRKLYLYMRMCVTVLFLGVAITGWAQSRTVTGTVTSADDGSPIPGVNVIEKGTSNGTVTDSQGNYTLSVADNATLVYSFVGYQPKEVVVGNQNTISIGLDSDVTALTEVVVVGYGTQEKKEITAAVASIKAEDFNRGTVNDPIQLLQGKVAGLNITRPGGDPNATFSVRVRGVSTFGANQEPLVVIDGVIGGSLNTVDPNDIASIDVLKDASAAAIYGSRGGSGVILVTTKSGKAGRVTADYNGSIAIENVANTIDVMSADEYRELPGAVDLGSETDWLDVVTQTGHAQVHNLSVGGGTQSTTYRASLNFRSQEGVGLNSNFQQLNTRINLSQKALKDKLNLSFALALTTKDAELGFEEAFNYAIIANPTMPVYDNTTTSPTAGANFGGYAERNIFDFFNPLSIAQLNRNDGEDQRLLVSARGEYDFSDVIPGLRGSVFYSQQRENEFREQFGSRNSKFGAPGLGIAFRDVDQKFNHLFETTFSYDKLINNLNVSALGGYSYQDFFNDGFGTGNSGVINDAFEYNALGNYINYRYGLNSNLTGSYANSNKLIAFFGRLNFNLNETYFLSASARYEGSSRFGADNKWGIFPALSAGATLSNIFDIPSVNSLKIRASYGITGNQPSDSYISLARYGRTGVFYYNGAYIYTFGPVSNPNPDLQWETKSEIDFGLDFSAFDNRLTGTMDYYIRDTEDLILAVNVPQPPNFLGQTILNIGEVRNKGYELALNYVAVDNTNFGWTTSMNLSTFDTEVVSLSSGDLSVGEGGVLFQANMGSPGQNDTRLIRVKEGEPLGQIWGPVQIGVNPDGTPELADLDGDGSFCNCDADRQVIGNGYVKMTFGWNNTFRFRQFDFNFFIRGAFGHDLVNSYRGFYENLEGTTVVNYNVVKTKYFDPTITKAQFNSSHVEDASYVRLDNATLGYSFNMTGKAVNRLRLYVSGQNLFTITDYTGIDPEVRYVDVEPDPDNALAPGIERRSTYFTTRIFTFGVNLGF